MSYLDIIGIPTIGYGRTKDVHEGQTCTQEQADQWLIEDIAEAEKSFAEYIEVDLNENQYAALTSFVYNVGAGREGHKDGLCHLKSGGRSHLLIYINEGAFDRAADELPRWAKVGGVTVPGLLNRRMDERELFLLNVG